MCRVVHLHHFGILFFNNLFHQTIRNLFKKTQIAYSSYSFCVSISYKFELSDSYVTVVLSSDKVTRIWSLCIYVMCTTLQKYLTGALDYET